MGKFRKSDRKHGHEIKIPILIKRLANNTNGMIIANNDQPRMRVKKQLKCDRPSGHGFS
jgi:hypothetical protein